MTGKLLAPVKENKQNCKDDPVCKAAKLMKTVIENDPTKEIIIFMTEDVKIAREHELKLYQNNAFSWKLAVKYPKLP